MTRTSKSQNSPFTEPPKTQVERFKKAARALECDESEERFDAALAKIAAHKPPKDSDDGAPKAHAKQPKDQDESI